MAVFGIDKLLSCCWRNAAHELSCGIDFASIKLASCTYRKGKFPRCHLARQSSIIVCIKLA